MNEGSVDPEALRAHQAYIAEYVVKAARKEMTNQVLRGGRLWIDGMWAADPEQLRARNITAICALGDPDANYPEPPEGVTRHHITIYDYHYEPIGHSFYSRGN